MSKVTATAEIKPLISVVIPTFRDWSRLKLCICALLGQSYDSQSMEIIVVNNDPEDHMPSDWEFHSEVKLINELQRGSYAARNKGLSVARGQIIAFTDSDCIPDVDWLLHAVLHLQNRPCDRVAGEIRLFFRSKQLSWAEIYEKAFGFPQRKYAAKGLAATANMVVWRRVIDEVGLFKSDLASGGDMEWGKRAQDAGKTIFFAPDVVVNHPARSTINDLLVKRRRIVTSRNKYWKKSVNQWIRGFAPPAKAIGMLAVNNNLTIREKLISYIVLYYLKIYKSYISLTCRTSSSQIGPT